MLMHKRFPCGRVYQGNGRCDPPGMTGISLTVGRTTNRLPAAPSHAVNSPYQHSKTHQYTIIKRF